MLNTLPGVTVKGARGYLPLLGRPIVAGSLQGRNVGVSGRCVLGTLVRAEGAFSRLRS